jgi:predicted CxxxxCH...CXXCH cytochrome family protein
MKRERGPSNFKRIVFSWTCSLGLLLAASSSAPAASTCSDCHGMPPIDAPYRNITSGGFRGSHQTHQPAVATAATCAACHTGSGAYAMDHLNGKVDMAANLNNSPLTATYSKGVFFNQTSNPVMGSCSSVNCHFEKVTTPWAGPPLAAPAGCSACHDNPPGDGNHPAITGAGKKHGDYYGTSTTSCGKCHPDHTAAAKPFAHATSVGHRGLLLQFSASPNSGGSYSKTANLAYPAYLPSQTSAANRNGTCATMYCHSDGAGGAAKSAAVWGGTLPADCSGCHGGNATAVVPIATGLHAQHVNNAALLGTNIACAACHNGTVAAASDRAVTGLATHVDGTKTIAFSGGGTYNATAKSCAATVCHAAGKATAPQPTVPSWTGAPLGCNGCHGISTTTGVPDYANGGAAALLANSHAKHVTGSADCDKCHTNTTTNGTAIKAGSTLHANGVIDVTFNTAKAGTGAVWTVATKSCATTSCHGSGAPVWGGTLPADCTGCHGDDSVSAAPIATGKHTAHINNPAVLGAGNNFGCVECHAKTVSNNRTVATPANHVNNFVDYSGVRAGGSASYSTTTKLCSNIYCHSNGNPAAIVYVNAPAWNGTASMGCNGCHGTSNATTGAPDYANGGAGTATANSHPKHVAGAGIVDTRGCANCHAKTVSQTVAGAFKDYTASSYHLNRTPNLFFKSIGGKTGAWNGSTCTNTYCHGAAASAAWGSASLACNACHAATNLLPGAHGIHYASTVLPSKFVNFSGNVSSATAYRFTCSSCHASGAGRATHAGGPANASGAAEVFYGYTTATQKGSYTFGTTQGADNGFNWTNGGTGCSTSYCHSNGQGGSGLAAVAWSTTTSSGTCVQCHDTKQTGVTATGLSGKHDKHMNPTNNAIMGLGNGLNCADCHAKTVSSNTVVANKLNHVNKFVEYSGLGAGGSARYNRATKQCSNIYCHSNGNPGAIVYVNPPAWNSTTTLGCNGCHGTTSTIGAPDYVNGGAVPSTTANSHTKHVAGATDTTICATCHAKTANAITGGKFKDYSAANYHLNRTPNVYFTAAKAGATATWTQASGTCSNVSCHGGTGSSVVWGSSINCQDCHGNGASASVADFGATFWNNGTASKFQMTGTGSWADTGHGRPTASGNYAGSANPPANFAGIANFCEWCHDPAVGHNVSTNPFRLRNWTDATWGKNGACMICHATGSAGVTVGGQLRTSAANKIGAYHYGAKHSTALTGGQFCWDCHDPHGTGTTNQYMIRPNVAMTSDATTGAPLTQSATSVVFALSATPTGTDYAKSAAPFNGICNVCHTTTSHYLTASGDGHNSGSRCTSCHSHNGDGITRTSGFTPVGGGVSSGGSPCYGCHSAFQSTMDATGATRTASYHHVLGGTAGTGDIAPNAGSYQTSTTDVYCTSCHADHNYFNNGGTVTTKGANLRSDITNASAAAPVNTDFLTTGNFGICVSCHKASLTRDTTNQKAGGVATTPVIDGAVFAASMHNYTTMSSFGTQPFAANCVKCHTDEQAKDKQTSANKFGPHFSASVSLLDDLGAGTNAQYREQYICFRCHSQTTDTALGGTLKAANGKDWFGSNKMRTSAEDTFKSFTAAGRSPRHKISAYTGLHKVNETRTDIAANKHVECADCHNPHAAKFGNHSSTVPGTAKGSRATTLANVLAGATGVSVTTWGANWAGVATTAYNPSTTTAPLVAATAEWQVCFKCHSGANANVATWGGTAAAAFTDLALEFNPNNAATHPVVAALPTANRLTAAKLKGGWVPGSIMTCSDCHATDSTASKGPHGSAVKWMLTGTNKAWPYTLASQNGGSTGTLFRIATYSTGTGTKDGLFCLNCHTVTASNNWHSNSNVTGGQHGSNAIMACASCHVRVPHGGKISRLLQTTNAPARYKSNGNGATSSFAAFGTSTVNIKGSAFASGSFKSSCGQHSGGGTGGEAW